MSVIWHKIWRDLANNKLRTALVVISTAVGVFALGVVFGLSGVMGEELTKAQRQAVPAHVTFQGGPFSSDVVEAIAHERGVRSAQGETVVPLRWRFPDEANWREGQLVARDEYDAQAMDLLRLVTGRWPSGRDPRSTAWVVAIDRLSAEHFALPPGVTVLIESGRRESRVSVQGVVHAYDVLSPGWGGTPTFYAAPESVARLTGYSFGQDFNRLQVRLDAFAPRAAEEAAERIEDRLERMAGDQAAALTVGGYTISDPTEHPMQGQVDAVLLVLGVMGGLSLGLSGFLIVNTINAILVREVRQIGVMKAVGATLLRIMHIYLGITAIYGVLALVVAVPLGVIGAHLVAVWLLGMFNVAYSVFQLEPLAILIQIVVGLAVPPGAALVPVLNAARITVREAIGDYGLGDGFGQGWADLLIAQIRGLPRTAALGLRNGFRRKGRLALTLVMLTFSGAMFTMVMSTKSALDATFQIIFELEGDVALSFEEPQRAWHVTQIAREVDGVTHAEVWSNRGAKISVADREEPQIQLSGVPLDSIVFEPRILEGRGLRPGDGQAILVNNRLVVEEGVQVGQTITLEIAGQESEWMVVGSYLSLNVLYDVCFVPREALGQEARMVGRGTSVKVLTEEAGIEPQQRLIQDLTAAYEAQKIEVTDARSASQQWQESESAFGVLIYLLLAMAILVAVVGSIGLMSTMSINVVERTREIGVMRAIGATKGAIVGVFIVEGMLVGLLSWLLAIPLSAPGAYLLSSVVGQAIVQIPLDFVYSVGGVFLWLLIVIVLSALASIWPALRATKVSVRESLAYE